MRSALMSLSLVLLCSIVVVGQATTAAQKPLAFTHVTVIDATGGPAQPDMTVVVTGNRITAIGKSGTIAVPANAQVTNARDQFLIPGLWDMHTHAFIRKNKILPLLNMHLYVANGVTGVRDMGDQGLPDDFGDFPWGQDFDWRRAISAGAAIGPRLVLAGLLVDGPNTPRAGWPSIADAAQGRKQVNELKAMGADFIKVYDRLPRDAYFAIVDEAKKLGLPFAGHVPFAITVAEASDAGQRSEEHLWGMLLGCSTREKELMPVVNAPVRRLEDRNRGLVTNFKALLDSYSEKKANALFAKFVKNHTFIVPTLTTKAFESVPLTDPRVVKYFTPALRENYKSQFAAAAGAPVSPERKLMYETDLRLVRDMNRAGVKLLAGTDTLFFGSGLHDELAQLVKVGLTPLQALQTATKNAAEYLGTLESMGTVEQGKVADLVLLDANPLDSIANTQKIRAVVVNGRLLDREALDAMLAQIEAAANGTAVKSVSR